MPNGNCLIAPKAHRRVGPGEGGYHLSATITRPQPHEKTRIACLGTARSAIISAAVRATELRGYFEYDASRPRITVGGAVEVAGVIPTQLRAGEGTIRT